MSTRTLPDIEDALIQYLLGTSVAVTVSDRIYADTPENVVYPFVRVHKITERNLRHWFAEATLQVEGWDHKLVTDSRANARDLCESVTAVLHDILGFTDGVTVLGRASVLIGPRFIPDPPTENPRFVADVLIPYHPVPS